ncbi:RhuM family protein [Actinomadura sp. 9N407]|uniref:RhuM family protein n=1 Tax=Actinomadura sp. 9N407 TaxID=3375154 RepID=UPI00379C22AF
MGNDSTSARMLGRLDFRGHVVSVYTDDRGSWVFVGQISALMGIDPNAQRQAIERKHWSEGMTCQIHAMLPGQPRAYPNFALHERRLPMWIATISTGHIKDISVRTEVEAWQSEFADALYDYLVQGGAIRTDATHEQIEVLHARIQAIRTSEKHAHRRLTDLIAETSADYDTTSAQVRRFFASVQNILLFAVSGKVAGELTTQRKIACYQGKRGPTKKDLATAKNYLTEKELRALEKLVGVFFDLADIRVMFRDDVTLPLWRDMLNDAIRTAGRPVLREHRPWAA